MIISKKHHIPPLSVKVKADSLEQCTSYKYLGIHIDKNLSWNTHIQYVTKKVLKACGAMAKLRHSFCIDTLKNVYYSLVYSYIRYGFFIWGNSPPSALSCLHTALHKVLRIMTFAPYGNIDLHPIYEFLQILNMDQIFSFELGKFLYKCNKNIYPSSSLGNYFEIDPHVNHHSYGLRSRTANVPTRRVTRTKFADKSTQIGGLKTWNKIPEYIQNSESLNVFKQSYKSYLMEPFDGHNDSLLSQNL